MVLVVLSSLLERQDHTYTNTGSQQRPAKPFVPPICLQYSSRSGGPG